MKKQVSWTMEELHEYEQYFFNQKTLEDLTRSLVPFSHICCLCAPLLGKFLIAQTKKQVTILDIDSRFSELPGFRLYNIYKPEPLTQQFDIIVCDPPFNKVSLSQLFTAIRLLSHKNYQQPVLLSYLRSRSLNVLGTFAPFGFKATGYLPGYQTVQKSIENEIEFFTNINDIQLNNE